MWGSSVSLLGNVLESVNALCGRYKEMQCGCHTQTVLFIASMSAAVVTGFRGGCRLRMR